jgi:Cytochrome c554 and c-prime
MAALFASWLAIASAAPADRSPDACAPCHRAETAAFASAGMPHALERVANDAILRTNPEMAVTIGEYSYSITRNGDQSIYTVTDGKDTLRVPIEWAFGQGVAGQTFVFHVDGRWFESRVSYFSALHGLDLTMGAQRQPHNLPEAAGHATPPAEMRSCFDCHATNVGKSLQPDLSLIREGVQCERCHGPSDAHLRAVPSGQAARGTMPKLAARRTEEISELCGQCHRTWAQVATNGPRGILNVRFQPYRLASSRCYDTEDRRIACTACHDPHRDVETSTAAYDAKCLACHSRAATSTRASNHRCRVATHDCVNCHMPRLDLPGAHQKFTDHRIRVVKAGEPYPD